MLLALVQILLILFSVRDLTVKTSFIRIVPCCSLNNTVRNVDILLSMNETNIFY